MKFQQMKPRILQYHCPAHLSECPLFSRTGFEGELVLIITSMDNFRKDKADANRSTAIESIHKQLGFC